jgi:hypothetical protein
VRTYHREGRGRLTAGATLALTPGFVLQSASVRAVTHTIGAALAAPTLRITAACLGVGLLAGLISLRTYHASHDHVVATPDFKDDPPLAATSTEDFAAVATRLDDLMLAALLVGLVACAVFVWLSLPRLMADG